MLRILIGIPCILTLLVISCGGQQDQHDTTDDIDADSCLEYINLTWEVDFFSPIIAAVDSQGAVLDAKDARDESALIEALLEQNRLQKEAMTVVESDTAFVLQLSTRQVGCNELLAFSTRSGYVSPFAFSYSIPSHFSPLQALTFIPATAIIDLPCGRG